MAVPYTRATLVAPAFPLPLARTSRLNLLRTSKMALFTEPIR